MTLRHSSPAWDATRRNHSPGPRSLHSSFSKSFSDTGTTSCVETAVHIVTEKKTREDISTGAKIDFPFTYSCVLNYNMSWGSSVQHKLELAISLFWATLFFFLAAGKLTVFMRFITLSLFRNKSFHNDASADNSEAIIKRIYSGRFVGLFMSQGDLQTL